MYPLYGKPQQGVFQRNTGNLSEIQKKVKEVIGIEASAGIGGWVRNPGDTIQSHNQAEKAIELRYLLGGNLLIDTETLNPERSISLQQPLSDMVDGIKKGNEAEMNQALSVEI